MAAHFGRTDAPKAGPVAESWEVSDRPDGMSVVANGPLAGQTLGSLIRDHRRELLGTAKAGAVFPLLIKILDARETLSIQVHPDDAAATRGIGEAKSEAWYVLSATPDACVYRGFRRDMNPDAARRTMVDGGIVDTLIRQPVKQGDFIYVPGGTVHAIGAGCLLLEVQQNSNTTYRLYDWGRTGPDGKTRALHLEEGQQVIDWTAFKIPVESGRGRDFITPYFSIRPADITHDPLNLASPDGGFTVVFVEQGSVVFDHGESRTEARAGTSWLIPAALKSIRIQAAGGSPARAVIIRGASA